MVKFGGIVIGETVIDMQEHMPKADAVLGRLRDAFDFDLAQSDIVELDERGAPLEPQFTKFYIDSRSEFPGGWVAEYPSGTKVVAEVVDWNYVPIPGTNPERCVKRYRVLYRQAV